MEMAEVNWFLFVSCIPICTFLLVITILIFTCLQARRIRDHPRQLEPEYDPEMFNRVRSELDEKYSSVPEEEIDQTVHLVHQMRKSNSFPKIYSRRSSKCLSGSNSQAAIDTMLHMLVDPTRVDESDTKASDDMDLREALSFFNGVEDESSVMNTNTQREPRRRKQSTCYPDPVHPGCSVEEKKKKSATIDERYRSLDLIIESDE